MEPASNEKFRVTELDNLWTDRYGSGFYDSCKDVKFGATGGKAMDFIGGGAKNYTMFLKFLGDTKPLGSPFQINFPRPEGKEKDGMKATGETPLRCNSTDERYRCACVDCTSSCPELPQVAQQGYCYVGMLPCLSFGVILIYSIFLVILVAAVSGHIAWQKHTQRKSERLQLLQDAAPSDDEDEGDVVENAGMLDRPQKYYYLNTVLDGAFSRLGGVCARYPATTICSSVIDQKGLLDAIKGPKTRIEESLLLCRSR